MEDPRLSRMYATLLTGNLKRQRQQAWRWTRTNRSTVMALLTATALVIFAIGYVAHLHGRFRKLKTELSMVPPHVELPPMPGGQEAVVMQRTLLAEGSTPEFLSATLLPGRGLNVFQIMLSLPGRGAIPLLASPSLEDAVKLMSGTQADATGAESLHLGSPIEAPWAGFIPSTRDDTPTEVLTNWRGRSIALPATDLRGNTPLSQGGALLKMEADSVKHNVLPDGGTVQGSFVASDFGGLWPSHISVSATALLSSRAFELKLVARNEGGEPAPVGLGWRPQILLPSGARTGVRLRLPADAHEEMIDGRATGRLIPVAGTPLDFTDRAGKVLRDIELEDTFVDLRSGFLDNGPVMEIRDTRSGVGIRMTAMSPQIRAIHLHTFPTEDRVVVGFQTNYDDPFSRVWTADDAAGISVLQPGQTLQWRLRMEVFAISDSKGPSL